MVEFAKICAQALFIACVLAGFGSGIYSLLQQLSAASNRRPNVPFFFALQTPNILMHPELYTQRALEARKKYFRAMLLFFGFPFAGLLIGITTGVAR